MLKELTLAENKIRDEDMQYLFDALQYNTVNFSQLILVIIKLTHLFSKDTREP